MEQALEERKVVRAERERERRAKNRELGKKVQRSDEYKARQREKERARRATPEGKQYELEYRRKYREENREATRAYGREFMRKKRQWMKDNGISTSSVPDKQREYYARWSAKNPTKRLFHGAKSGAVRRGLEFTIVEADIHWPTHCPVLGIELDYTGNGEKYKRSNAPSLDRWDGSKGYVPGNVFVISWRANWLKHDGTPDELAAVANYAKHGLAP